MALIDTTKVISRYSNTLARSADDGRNKKNIKVNKAYLVYFFTITLFLFYSLFIPPRIRITTKIPKTAICYVSDINYVKYKFTSN